MEKTMDWRKVMRGWSDEKLDTEYYTALVARRDGAQNASWLNAVQNEFRRRERVQEAAS